MKKQALKLITLYAALCAIALTAHVQTACGLENALVFPSQGKNGMVVAGQEAAARAGLEVLKGGGNAVDAAVTVAFVMAVTLPRAGNIGGGGFMLIHSVKTREIVAIDYWQKAPGRAFRNLFMDRDGNADLKLRRQSHLATAVPGTVAGLAMALKKFGTISLAQALAPAIKYAEEGFMVNGKLAADMKAYETLLRAYPATAKIFVKPDGKLYEAGDMLVQKDLAGTLKAIAKDGPDAFYKGATAGLIVKQMQENGGLITSEDLAAYEPLLRTPVRGSYRGYDVISMSPPSAGGVHIIGILNILEGFDLGRSGHNSAATIHLTAEAMKRAFADLSEYLGDPDFVKVPVKGLTSKRYAADLRAKINPRKATAGKDIRPGDAPRYERDETTHFSVVDKEGNAVSSTYTLNGNFGNGIVVEGAGFLLNNEMDNFNVRPGRIDESGIREGEANAIAPNKRMLSAMSPTIVMKDGKVFLVTGSPGSSRIISTNLQVIMNIIDHGMNIQEAVNAPRVHNEWLPDELQIEKGISPDTIKLLSDMGHTVTVGAAMGASSSILVDGKTSMRYGAADPRREGSALGY
ncbi:MAG: gamma-glutamyltransferase [Syntrophales bacterium]|jgi:gamma-glutamyltranspeptidase/glutathione hydrolase|nr:gamma-glutamyltransferase [Syntrophales bacterium]MCK9390409.1 gamma-glutamyltransferase [Syntrophales bacterium]